MLATLGRGDDNLFARLFKYRETSSKSSMEDFITEGVAYLLQKDKTLLNRYLDRICSAHSTNRTDIEIKTQYTTDRGHRIDLAIFWTEAKKEYSLFVEHKIESFPWEEEDPEGTTETQIDAYCRYQDSKNGYANPCNLVALFTRNQIEGYSKDEQRHASYLGNFTWSVVANLIKKGLNSRSTEMFLLQEEFLNFMRRHDMAGFENFTIPELSAISFYKAYRKKRNSLGNEIIQHFKKREDYFKASYKLKRIDAKGEGNKGYRSGVIFHDEGKLDDASLWVIFGLSSAFDDPWSLEPLCNEQKIPDIECAIYLWFESEKELKDFSKDMNLKKENWVKARNGYFELDISRKGNYWLLSLAKREPLTAFISKNNQEEEIISFLDSGFEEISRKDSFLEKLLIAFTKR